jgi:hypothetical protein
MAVEPDSIPEFMAIVKLENAFVKEIGFLETRKEESEFIRFKK